MDSLLLPELTEIGVFQLNLQVVGMWSRSKVNPFSKNRDHIMAPFASLKKQAETLFPLICHERKTLFRLKKQAEKYGLQEANRANSNFFPFILTRISISFFHRVEILATIHNRMFFEP